MLLDNFFCNVSVKLSQRIWSWIEIVTRNVTKNRMKILHFIHRLNWYKHVSFIEKMDLFIILREKGYRIIQMITVYIRIDFIFFF